MAKTTAAVAKTELPAGLFADGDAEEIVQEGWVRRKVNPLKAYQAAVDQAEKDGDPRFDFMVSAETLKEHPDKRFIWAPQEDVRGMTGKQRGYTQCYGRDAKLASGVEYGHDELIEQDGCVLMMCDESRRADHEERERRTNAEQRRAIIRRNSSNADKIIWANGDGSAVRENAPVGVE